jgi:hypothetical protein
MGGVCVENSGFREENGGVCVENGGFREENGGFGGGEWAGFV